MNTPKTILALAIAAIAAVAATPAFALTESTTYAYPASGTVSLDFPAGAKITVNQFNTAGGTKILSQIDINVSYSGNSELKFENTGSGSGTVGISRGVQFELQRPGDTGPINFPTNPLGALINLNKPLAGLSFIYQAYDGTTDYASRSGTTTGSTAYSKTGTSTFTSGADGSTLATFTGGSTILLPILNAIGYSVTGGGQSSIITPSTGSATVQVVYTYTVQESQVPEPRVYGAIGAVACLGLLGYRRLRARQAAQT